MFIAVLLLAGCESAEETREREIAERIELELLEKQAEEDRLEREKQAEKNRLAAIETEKEYAAVRRRDGIFSQSQALSKCKNELISKTNTGYYNNYSVERQKRMMTNQINSCMYQYGYFGN